MVSVNVCAHMMHRRNDVRDAIASLCQQAQRPDQIVLVIDHDEELLACTTSALSQWVVVVANREARGLSGGRNTGVAAATRDLITFIDDGAVADASWLDIPLARCKGPDILGASGCIDPLWAGLHPAWLPEEFLSATNSGFTTAKFERHWASVEAKLRVGMAE